MKVRGYHCFLDGYFLSEILGDEPSLDEFYMHVGFDCPFGIGAQSCLPLISKDFFFDKFDAKLNQISVFTTPTGTASWRTWD